MRREDLGLREHRGEADVERDVVLVDEAAGLARHLVHHPGAQRRQRPAVVLGDVAGVVADGGEDAVRGVGDEAVRPEVLRAGVEVRRELQHRVAQLIVRSIHGSSSDQRQKHADFQLQKQFQAQVRWLTATPLRLKILSFLLNSTMASASCGM